MDAVTAGNIASNLDVYPARTRSSTVTHAAALRHLEFRSLGRRRHRGPGQVICSVPARQVRTRLVPGPIACPECWRIIVADDSLRLIGVEAEQRAELERWRQDQQAAALAYRRAPVTERACCAGAQHDRACPVRKVNA